MYLDLYQDKSHPESQVDHDPMVEELRDRVRFMERQLEAERDAHREARRIIAGLVQRIPELEAPREETAPSQQSEDAAHAPAETAPGPAPPAGGTEGSGASERSWWNRWFGG